MKRKLIPVLVNIGMTNLVFDTLIAAHRPGATISLHKEGTNIIATTFHFVLNYH